MGVAGKREMDAMTVDKVVGWLWANSGQVLKLRSWSKAVGGVKSLELLEMSDSPAQINSTELTCGTGVFPLLHSVFSSPTMRHQCCTILTPGIFIHAAPATFMLYLPTYVHTCLIPSFI